MDWAKAAIDNLIPLSKEQDDLATALNEWCWSAGFEDYGSPIETCQLCTKTGLRYHFEIFNKETQNTLLVGSSCITRFDIAVYDEAGQQLKGKARDKKLTDKISEAKRERSLAVLRELWGVSEKHQNFIKKCGVKFKESKGVSPKELFFLFNLLEQHNLQYDPSLYKISLRKRDDKEQLIEMSDPDRNMVWPALEHRQRILIKKFEAELEREKVEWEERLRELEKEKAQREKERVEGEERQRQLGEEAKKSYHTRMASEQNLNTPFTTPAVKPVPGPCMRCGEIKVYFGMDLGPKGRICEECYEGFGSDNQ